MKYKLSFLILIAFALASFISLKQKPVLYIIGDSTVKNGSGKGGDGLWGWGSFLHEYFKLNKIDVDNRAIGGRSSRTFITEGRWDDILKNLKKVITSSCNLGITIAAHWTIQPAPAERYVELELNIKTRTTRLEK